MLKCQSNLYFFLDLWNSECFKIKQLDFEWKGSKSKGKQPRLSAKVFESYKD